ncbi:MAG TPA: cofactor-independent phosphoglycerate mutase [Spirochaetota bacterium]|nr:cofactor-independent phosphoglycerate mutase [Spirochaetota bacterium]HPI89197.1 cofactor-independent phosphoglycerate mutase [Spirochaetota bacterium]HPR48986.1 cofactor-independent phosphoglycerate mutase [Spirochaetota bacterium]
MSQKRKYIILLGDGMADYPVESLGGRTPLQAARTPNMDLLCSQGILGLAKTVPDGMAPGSDTANLSVFGYDPGESYTGRAPLEALSMGLVLGENDIALRCNIVNALNARMNSFTAGHIHSDFSKIIIGELNRALADGSIEFHAGVSYRNILIWRNYPYADVCETTPPHDIQDRDVRPHLPRGKGADRLIDIMERSRGIIASSAAVQDARKTFKGDPESVWLWGGGRKPHMQTLEKRYGLKGYTISAVDLIHGIGKAAGLDPLEVKGATGYIDTDYEGKAAALLRGIEQRDLVYLHVESPDESGHEGNLEHKMQAIEDFDKKIVGRVAEGMKKFSDYALLVMPDHPTPLSLRTHTSDPVPFCMFRSAGWQGPFDRYRGGAFTEADAKKTGLYIGEGHRLIELMINGVLG